ncbi:MAG: hypothetical protein OXE77_09160 [Flavobacteriaceae bacterium]|nr:hypothetical protein [Flavobacteriaceae bacterium]MCY4267680.1 hypothetical protein [Flavobacteriaceae bacterium]
MKKTFFTHALFLSQLLFFGCDNNQDEIDDLKQQVNQLISQNKDVSSIEVNLKNLDERIKSLCTSVGNLPTSDAVKDVIEDELKSQVESGQGELTGLSDSIKKINEHLTALELEVNPPSADKVVDDGTLKAFVDWAKSRIESVTDVTEAAEIELQLRKKGDFNDGDDTYLLKIHQESGDLLTHGKDRTLEGLTLKGVKVFDDLIKEAESDGGFVDYTDNGKTKKAYAVSYKDQVTKVDYVLIGAYTQDLNTIEPAPKRNLVEGLENPKVTASQVINRKTLKEFVEEAIRITKDQFGKRG